MLPALLRSANLSADQQTKMHDILKASRTAARPIFASLRQAQQDLADRLLAPGAVGVADVQPQLDKINQLRGQLLQNSVQAALDIRAILTADQIAKAADTKDKLRQLRQEIHDLLRPSQP
jgi:Spy/CpxP family protein refolding chaperone